MNDPHVAALTYQVLRSDDFEFKDAPPLRFETPDFTAALEDNTLKLTPKEHFASEAEALAVAMPFVRSWEIDAGLFYGRPDFRLRYTGAQLVDRAPEPGKLSVHISSHASVSTSMHAKTIRHEYPPPNAGFAPTPEVEVIWDRFCGYVGGREPLLSMAYFCLTLLERGDRKAAAAHFGIDGAVLSKIGELTSERGDGVTARKVTPRTKPLSGTEREWLEKAIRAIARHLATSGTETLSMAHLPALP